MTQPGLPHGAGPRRSAAAAATPRWAPRGGGGRLRHPCVRHAKGGGCYPADAARGLRSEDGRARKGAPRGPAPGAGQSSSCRTRGNQGLCYPAVGPARARRGLHAQPLPPARAHAHTLTARARAPPHPGPGAPPARQAASPAAARGPRGFPPGPPRPPSEPTRAPPRFPSPRRPSPERRREPGAGPRKATAEKEGTSRLPGRVTLGDAAHRGGCRGRRTLPPPAPTT